MAIHRSFLTVAVAACATLLFADPAPVQAQSGVYKESGKVLLIGSRRALRSSADAPTPVTVIEPKDLTETGVSDLSSLMRAVVPSWNVNTQPISDAATIIRPYNLRGFNSDQSLTLLNGKRRHRGGVIAFLAGGGIQGPDVSVIPAIALKRVEVLKDSASAQYGSDAIAGAVNFVLKDAPKGGTVETQWGQTYEGDGDEYRVSANVGLPMGSAGFLNLSGEFRDAEATSRSVQRADAQALIDGGIPVRQPHAQVWGRPDTKDDYKLFANFGLDAGLYAFGNYAQREVEGGFFWRNPTFWAGVFADDDNVLVDSRRNRDGSLAAAECTDTDTVDNLGMLDFDEDNCFSFHQMFPGGYTPDFGGEVRDAAGTVGFRNALSSGLGYDVSLTIGENRVDHFISNTVNPSLGHYSPTSFDLGAYVQTEHAVNVDLTHPLDVDFFDSPLNIAGGFEWREEEFEITEGDAASCMAGPYSTVHDDETTRTPFTVGADGFRGFCPEESGSWSRDSIAFYLDLESDVRDDLTVSTAVRWEDIDDVGSETSFKLAALQRLNEQVSLRGSVNTGFRAPTVGQENVSKVSTVFFDDVGGLRQLGRYAPTAPISRMFGGTELKAEESLSFSAGVTADLPSVAFTVDVYTIKVEDRLTSSKTFTPDDYDGAGTNPFEDQNLNPLDIERFEYFVNGFDTRTRGLDIVSTFDITGKVPGSGQGKTEFVLAFNYTKTDVTAMKADVATNVRRIEEGLPRYRFHGTLRHDRKSWRALARLNYFGSYTGFVDTSSFDAGSEYTVDVEGAYRFGNGFEAVVGATNLFNNFPDGNPNRLGDGAKYPDNAPGGLDGGFYYARLKYTW